MLKRFYAINLSRELRARLEAAMPAFVFLLSLSVFGAAALWRATDIRSDAEVEIQHASERLSSEVVRRLQQPIYGLNGARGTFAHDDKLNRAEFRAYVESRDLPKEFPGVRGFGFIQRVAHSDLNAFVAAERADGAPEFTVHPFPAPGQADLYLVRFIEPAADNAGVLGLDNSGDPMRRSAMQRAIDSGEPTMSEPITLLQDQRRTPGALLLVPVYRKGTHPSNTTERRAELLGLLAAPIVIEEMLRGLPEVASGLFDIEVFDGTASNAGASLIYDSDLHGAKLDVPARARANHRYSALKTLSVMGRELSVRINTESRFNATLDNSTPWLVLVAGIAISALLALYLRRRWQQHSLVLDMVQERTSELNREQLRLQTILETATDGIHILDAEGLLVQANPAFLRLLGLDESAIGRLHVSDWDAQLDRDAIRLVIGSLIKTESSSLFESQSRHCDGHVIDVEISARGIVIDGQSLVYCSSREITERKRSETALREKERDLRTLIDNMPSMIGYWDKNLRCRFGNAAYTLWFGVDPNQMPGMHFRDVIGETLYQLNLPHIEAVLRGEKQRFERAIPTPDGSTERHSLAEYIPDIVNAQVQGFYAMVSDISDIKQAESERLHRLETLRLRDHALSQISQGVMIADSGRLLTYINDRAERITGYTRLELLGKSCGVLQGTDTDPQTVARMRTALSEAQAFQGEILNYRKDGTPFWNDLSITPVFDETGRVSQFVGVQRDITERKNAEKHLLQAKEAAEAANRAKSQFLATMSHEVRTPMNGILGMAQVLLMPNIKDAERVEYVRTILSSGQTLLRLLNDLLDLAKIEAGKLEIESIPVSPKQILEQTLALFAESAQAKGLKIETDWRGSSASYLGDPHRLAQMLSNMTSNAIKFTSHGGIRIEAREVEGNGPGVTLEFAVSDSGMGIALDKQDLLFQRFSQLDSSITRSFGGTGLGLSIVRTLAHLMGGEVGVQSQVGQGSRFWFRIRTERLAGADGPDLAATPATDTWTAPARAPESARVLLAEDNIDHQRLIQLLLDRLGVCVILAENGQQALDAITRGESAQLILMDLHMPLLDGYATAQRIRQWEQEKQQPRRAIIALTADAYEEDRQRCLGAGMDEVLTKPVSFESLKMTLGRWLCAAPAATPAPPGAQYKALDAALLLRLLEEIEPMLENNQFDAIARFRELQDATVGTALAPALTLAASALQEFRFDKALTQLRQIKASQAWGGSEHDS